MRDWLLFGRQWGHTDCVSATNPDGIPCFCDLNADGRCDMRDWLLFGRNWGRTDCPIFNNSFLEGAWIFTQTDPPATFPVYIIADGQGNIIDIGAFETVPNGYSVNADGTFSMYFIVDGTNPITMTGRFVSSTSAEVNWTYLGVDYSGKIDKVPDRAACEGIWEGALVESATMKAPYIWMIVGPNGQATFGGDFDADGEIEGSGYLFSLDGAVTAFVRTNAGGSLQPYDQIKIMGTLSFSGPGNTGGTIEGTFRNNDMGEGSIHLRPYDEGSSGINVICFLFGNGQYWVAGLISDPGSIIQSARIYNSTYGSSNMTYNKYPDNPGEWWTDPNIQVNPVFPQTWTIEIYYKDGTSRSIPQTLYGWRPAE